MAEQFPPKPNLAAQQRIDVLCDEFERQWLAGERPQLSEFLSQAPAEEQSALLSQLVLLDCDYRRGVGETPAAEDYISAAPTFAAVITATLKSRTQNQPFAAQPLQTLGNYTILEKLGQGGMGMVLKAEHRRMERIVAIKILSPAVTKTPEVLRRFQQEVKAAAKLTHPNIAHAYDADVDGDTHFLVMEFVDGRDVATIVNDGGPLPIAQAVEVTRQVARGLAYAHSKGIVHRDIKPANLLLNKDGIVKILDLGLARIEDPKLAGLTQSGDVMGTIDYMAPEQAAGMRNVDPRADIYSLGCTLFRLLTAQNLFSGETLVQRLMAHQQQPIPSLSAHRPDVPPGLVKIFERMVAKKPEDRIQSMFLVDQALADLKIPPADLSTHDRNAERINSATSDTNSRLKSPTLPLREVQLGDIAPTIFTLAPHARRSTVRTLLIAAGFGALLLCFGIWVIIRDRSGQEVGRMKIPEGGTATTTEKPPVPESAATNKIADTAPQKGGPTPPPVSTANDFVSLFNGKTFTGWRGQAREEIPADWKIEDKMIVGPGKNSVLFTVAEFDNFELELDWKLEPGANGGVFYRWDGTTHDGGSDGILPVAAEYQIVDNVLHPNGRNPSTSCGSLFGVLPPLKDTSKPAGEWNSLRIVARGKLVEHHLNGDLVVSYELQSEQWNKRLAETPSFVPSAQYAKIETGRIGLQSFNGKVWFRNLKIRKLTAD